MKKDTKKEIKPEVEQKVQGKGRLYRKTFTFLFKEGAEGDDLMQKQVCNCFGEIIHICEVDSPGSSPVMTQLSIKNEDGLPIWDGGRAIFNPHHYDFVAARRMMLENDTIRCAIANDPGPLGLRVDVIVSLIGG